ncbi:MAG TPA: HipA domain-containing protein [Candidatus Tectomicrobia bacterium]
MGSGRLRLEYVAEAIDRWGLGSRILSVAAPLSTMPMMPAATAAIIEGLLPEGQAMDRLKALFGVRYAGPLLRVLGRETVGAVVVLPEGESFPADEPMQTPALKEGDIAARLRGLPHAPLGVAPTTNVRISLAGAQPKLPLTRSSDGTLHDPTFSQPSTVILKPEPSAWPHLVELEAYGLAVMRAAGVPTPDSRIVEFEGIHVLEVDRYDRVIDSQGLITRVHQEDLCMAVGARPAMKYATSPRSDTALSKLARVVYENSRQPDQDLTTFVAALLVNIGIGNCDAHARNLSLLHIDDGSVELAPVYDVVPTYHYRSHSRHLAQPINANVLRPEMVTQHHLQAELNSWRVPNVQRLLETSMQAVEAALAAVPPPERSELRGLFARQRLFK